MAGRLGAVAFGRRRAQTVNDIIRAIAIEEQLTMRGDRREFLRWTASGAAGVILSSSTAIWGRGGIAYADRSADKDLIVHPGGVLNAEPALDHLVQSWITPVKHFYVRNHAPIPELDAATFRLSVEGMVERPGSFTLGKLKSRFDSVSTVATMTCAGNRRNEHSRVKPVSGVQWGAGAIGNARWTGIRLGDLLRAVGVRAGAKHVWFEGVDEVPRDDGVIGFGGSIPLETALAVEGDKPGALVAYAMNDEALRPEHGYPMRTVVPGHIGARSVKWLGKIMVSDRPSPNHYVAGAYKVVTNGSDEAWAEGSPIYRFPINSVICVPGEESNLSSGKVRVRGYALPEGTSSSAIERVEVSADGGMTWSRARLGAESESYCWRLWEVDVVIGKANRELVVRATGSNGTTQPEHVEWNLKGYLFNAWHHVRLGPS